MFIAIVCSSSDSVGDGGHNLLELAHHIALQRFDPAFSGASTLLHRLALAPS